MFYYTIPRASMTQAIFVLDMSIASLVQSQFGYRLYQYELTNDGNKLNPDILQDFNGIGKVQRTRICFFVIQWV